MRTQYIASQCCSLKKTKTGSSLWLHRDKMEHCRLDCLVGSYRQKTEAGSSLWLHRDKMEHCRLDCLVGCYRQKKTEAGSSLRLHRENIELKSFSYFSSMETKSFARVAWTENAAAPPPKLHKADAAESPMSGLYGGERSSESGAFKSGIY